MTKLNALKNFIPDNSHAALILSPENVRYFTSFSSSNGYLLVTSGSCIFFTDSRYIEAAKKQITVCDEIFQLDTIEKTIAPLIENLGISKIYVEQSRLTLKQLAALKKAIGSVEFLIGAELDSVINELRSVKTESERVKIEKAQRIAERAFDEILKYIAIGKTERDVSIQLDYLMLKGGAQALSFETIVVSGPNTSMPHGVPGERKIANGDFITFDFGAVYDGYHSDMTRTIAVGSVSDKQVEVYNTVLSAQLAGLEKIKAGNKCKDIDLAARNLIEDKGYGKYFGHSFGHGVGIEIHEYPNLSAKNESVLKVGNVVTAEPGIYLPGEFGVRIEDMVFVTDNGYENLTKSSKTLIVL